MVGNKFLDESWIVMNKNHRCMAKRFRNMSIRRRLILSNIAMILVPVMLFGVTAFSLSHLFLGDFTNMDGEGYQNPWVQHQHNHAVQSTEWPISPEFARVFFPLLFLSFILILILTNGFLSYFVAKSIIIPVKELMQASKSISEGNLDFHIQSGGHDELGQLSKSFEKMRQKLKESTELQIQYEENRKELIASISHDLKTPITAIKGYIEGIQDGVANTPEKMERYIKTINTKANDLDQLIDELFLYSKLDLRRVPFYFEKVDVKVYLLDIVEELQFDVNKDDTLIMTVIEDAKNYEATLDCEKVKRVIMNLVNNSLKYTDKDDKQIQISLKAIDDAVLIEVGDNGSGIPNDALPFIFDRFYRGDPSRNTKTGGSGLGLAIAKRIVEEHGGRIWAESVLGHGTSVFFTLKKSLNGSV